MDETLIVPVVVPIVLNLVGIGVAYGLIRGRLDALEKAEERHIEALAKVERETKAEIVLTRDRVHELSGRMSELVLEIVRLRNGGAR